MTLRSNAAEMRERPVWDKDVLVFFVSVTIGQHWALLPLTVSELCGIVDEAQKDMMNLIVTFLARTVRRAYTSGLDIGGLLLGERTHLDWILVGYY